MMRILFLLIVTTSVLFSQEPSPLKVTLDDALRIALERNKELTTARLEVEKAEARVMEAWGYALPALDLSGRYTRALERPVFFLPDFSDLGSNRTVPVKIGTEHAFDLTLTARQTLFNSTVIIGVGAAKVYADVARELYRARQIETAAAVRKAFYNALLAGEIRNLMQANLANAEENLRNVQTLVRQGLVSEYDELRATVGVENLKPEVIRSENNYALAIDALRAAMGIGVSEPIEIVGSLEYKRVSDDRLETALDAVSEQNVSLKALRLQIEVNRAFASAERSNYLPTLSAFGNLQYQAAKNAFVFSTNDFFRSAQVGLTLSVNLFQGLQTNARVDQAELEVRKSQEQLSNLEVNLRTAAHSFLLQLRQAQRRIEAQEKTVEQAERGYRIATTRFLNGSGTQLEVNDAQLALTQAKVNRIQAIHEYLIASADLDQTLGVLPEAVQERALN